MACNSGLLCVNTGLLWGIVACYLGLLGFPSSIDDILRTLFVFVMAGHSGKSTSIQLLERFYDPCSGAVLVNGLSSSLWGKLWKLGVVLEDGFGWVDTSLAPL